MNRSFQISLKDKAIYWQLIGQDDANEPVFAKPVIIRCRWESGTTSLNVSDDVESFSSPATVFTDTVLVLGSRLMLGCELTLKSLPHSHVKNPRMIRGVKTIKEQEVASSLRHRTAHFPPGTTGSHLVVEIHT